MSLLPRATDITVDSADLLSDTLKHGLIPVSFFAFLSAISTTTLLTWITYRLFWRKEYLSYGGYNQYVILIYNLLLADLQQSISFTISTHWLRIGQIESPSHTCFAQGWLLHMGDVSSGFFVLAIAIHTWYSVVLGRRLSYKSFMICIFVIWGLAALLTLLGPAIHGVNFFVRAGAWCWADQKYDQDRLWLHYIWIFVDEFGTIIIYTYIFIHLRNQLRSIRLVAFHQSNEGPRSKSRLSQAARYMILYPLVYIILTLPLAAGRMAAMAGTHLPEAYFCVAGSLITSCGWLDCVLYTLTRRVLVKNETRERIATAHSHTGTNHSKRRWAGRDNEALATNSSTWPLSSFASVDFKEASATESDELSFDSHGNLVKGRTTPGLDEMLRHHPDMSVTETMILKGDEAPVVENRIFSETRIEVVSLPRDNMSSQGTERRS